LKQQPVLESDATFMQIRSQAADSGAGVPMGLAPVRANRFDCSTDLAAFGFGQLPQLREEIGVDLNR
jgi:hypothetical protein